MKIHRLRISFRISIVLWLCISLALACSAVADDNGGEETGHSSREDSGSPKAAESPEELDDDALAVVKDVWTDPGEIPRFKMEIDGEKHELPLKHTHVEARIVGTVAHVEVKQTYENPLEDPIETVYVFPLPENSAVNDMEMVIGERVVKADIQKRDEARETYENAKDAGNTAALLEQERPNIFTQSVANIAPKETIDVTISYVQDLAYDAGEYEFVFPMVVGPRYIPGAGTGTASGTGWSEDTTEVGDASRITPPVVGGGKRTGHDISLHVQVDAGFPVKEYAVPTHRTAAEIRDDGTLDLALAEAESIPNRDFVLRYAVDGEEPVASLVTQQGDNGGHFTLIVQPPSLDVDSLVGKREFVFVVDVSGSMSGKPLAMAKDAMQRSLRGLRPKDTFNVIVFASREAMLWSSPRPANNTNLVEALGFIDGLSAGGGTEMGSAIDAAFAMEGATDRHRYVFFMTDGFVGNEKAILGATERFTEQFQTARPGQRSRVFGFGIGSSPNRHLIEGLGEAGDGASVYATNREDPSRAVNKFFGLVDRPIITDIEVDWGALQTTEVYPSHTPDLFASRPLVLHGKYEGDGKTEVVVSGKVGDEVVELYVPVEVKSGAHGDPVQATLWARSKVGALQVQLWEGFNEKVKEDIEAIGLNYRLVTPFTSLVAVDYERTVDGELKKIVQPVDGPEDVDLDKALPAEGQVGTSGGGSNVAYSSGGDSFGSGSGSGSGYGYGGMGTRGRGSGKGKVKPKVKYSAPKVMGSMDRTAVRRVIKKRTSAYRACYEQALLAESDLAGRIVLKIVIGADGIVKAVSITKDSVGDDDMASCVEKVTWGLKFPESSGDIVITYPFVFSPS